MVCIGLSVACSALCSAHRSHRSCTATRSKEGAVTSAAFTHALNSLRAFATSRSMAAWMDSGTGGSVPRG